MWTRVLQFGAVIIGILLLLHFQAGPSEATAESIPIGKIVSGALIALFIIATLVILTRLLRGTGGVSISWSTGGIAMQALTSFLVVTLLFYVMYQANPDAPLFNTSDGWGHIALYYVLGIAVGMVAANFTGWRALSLGAIIFVVFALTGEDTLRLYDSSGHITAWLHSRTPAATIAYRCDGEVHHAVVGAAPVAVNPGGRCSFTWDITKGQVELLGPNNYSEVWWPGKVAVGMRNVQTVSARAVNGDGELNYMLCPPDSPTHGWSCR